MGPMVSPLKAVVQKPENRICILSKVRENQEELGIYFEKLRQDVVSTGSIAF